MRTDVCVTASARAVGMDAATREVVKSISAPLGKGVVVDGVEELTAGSYDGA